MNILLWHLHRAWTAAFLSGPHSYFIPELPGHGADDHGGPARPWPDSVTECTALELADTPLDVVILQRPEEADLAEAWTGRRPGRDLPAIYVEHDSPSGDVLRTRHPVADRTDVHLVHVTHFNDLFWDSGRTPTTVIEHGIPDPGHRYTGDLGRLATTVNEPALGGRATGTDLLPRFTEVAPVDVYGIGVRGLSKQLGATVVEHDGAFGEELYSALAQRRAYLHLSRWTALGPPLLEAMSLGMPVIVLGTADAADAVPDGAGIVSTNVQTLVEGARWLCADHDAARDLGERGRQAVLWRYGLKRFLSDWDLLLGQVTGTAWR